MVYGTPALQRLDGNQISRRSYPLERRPSIPRPVARMQSDYGCRGPTGFHRKTKKKGYREDSYFQRVIEGVTITPPFKEFDRFTLEENGLITSTDPGDVIDVSVFQSTLLMTSRDWTYFMIITMPRYPAILARLAHSIRLPTYSTGQPFAAK